VRRLAHFVSEVDSRINLAIIRAGQTLSRASVVAIAGASDTE
jgi:hypothetical protein